MFQGPAVTHSTSPMKPLVSQALGLEPQEGLVLYVVHVKSSPPPRQLGSHCPTWGVGGQDHSALPRAAVLKQRQVLLGLFLSGQNHSSTDLSRVFRQETPLPICEGKGSVHLQAGQSSQGSTQQLPPLCSQDGSCPKSEPQLPGAISQPLQPGGSMGQRPEPTPAPCAHPNGQNQDWTKATPTDPDAHQARAGSVL